MKRLNLKKRGDTRLNRIWYPRNKMASVALRSSTHALWLARYMHPFPKTIYHTSHLLLLWNLHNYIYNCLLVNSIRTLHTNNTFTLKKTLNFYEHRSSSVQPHRFGRSHFRKTNPKPRFHMKIRPVNRL